MINLRSEVDIDCIGDDIAEPATSVAVPSRPQTPIASADASSSSRSLRPIADRGDVRQPQAFTKRALASSTFSGAVRQSRAAQIRELRCAVQTYRR